MISKTSEAKRELIEILMNLEFRIRTHYNFLPFCVSGLSHDSHIHAGNRYMDKHR